MKKSYVVWGAWTALAAPLLALTAVAFLLTLSYDGKCGGFMPWLASAKPCRFADYVFSNLTLLALIVWVEFWPVIIVVLALPVGIGYMLTGAENDFPLEQSATALPFLAE